MAAMAQGYRPHAREDKPLAMISTLSTIDKCRVRGREVLTARGYEVMVFYILGTRR
jgi:hypothetical protein